MINLKARREKLFKDIPDNSLIVLCSGKSIKCSGDSTYDFIVNRNFYYATNISQENTYLIIYKNNITQEFLFIDEYSELKEKWFGRKITSEEAKKISDINCIYTNKDLSSVLDRLLSNEIKNIYVDNNVTLTEEIIDKLSPYTLKDIFPTFVNARMIKEPEEIEQIKKAIQVTNLGFKRIIKELETAKKEYEIYNAFNHEIMNNGTHEIGFPSIIACGVNACILHYPTPFDDLQKDSLILCDVGAAYNHYSADITRTLPISGKFNELQKKIYEIVLGCNKATIKYIEPGKTIKELQTFAKKYLADECLAKGLISNLEEIDNYYYHGVSHHLGLDTHDISDREALLKPSMVLTVEPGLYFKQYKIGVRIEDDVLVTETGSKCLSDEIKKEIKDIEELFIQSKNRQ